MSDVRMCDKDPSQQAVYSYRFDWGEEGAVCAEQATILQQVAAQTGRNVLLVPLSMEPPPPTLDERRQYHATQLALQDELEAARARGLELYRSNQAMALEMRAARSRQAELESQIVAHSADVAKLSEALAESNRQNAQLVAELQQVKRVADLAMDIPVHVDAPAEGHSEHEPG